MREAETLWAISCPPLPLEPQEVAVGREGRLAWTCGACGLRAGPSESPPRSAAVVGAISLYMRHLGVRTKSGDKKSGRNFFRKKVPSPFSPRDPMLTRSPWAVGENTWHLTQDATPPPSSRR